MTLEEMKLAVCEKLAQSNREWSVANDIGDITWNGTVINWQREGLQVCHEAEKLVESNPTPYNIELFYIIRRDRKFHGTSLGNFEITHATYEQKLKALCRVWFPERFN